MYLQYRYSLEPSRAQHARLREILALQRNLYNAALENRRTSLRVGRHLTYQDDCAALGPYRREHPEQAALPWGVNNWTLRRLDAAMALFARRQRSGDEPGLPRFRSEARWRSFGVYGLKGWSLRPDRLCLDGIAGAIRIHMHRPLPIEAKAVGVTLTREARRWFVTILISLDVAREHPIPGSACGIAIGTGNLLTLSDGTHMEGFRPASRKSAALRRARRALERCQRESRRRRKVRDRVARAHRAIRNARTTHLHDISAAIVKSNAFIAVADPSVDLTTGAGTTTAPASKDSPTAKDVLRSSLTDVAPAHLIEKIRYKAEKAGGSMITVDPRQSAGICHSCGVVQNRNIASRHSCLCGADLHKDHNTALNILARGLAAHAAATGRRVGKALPNASLQAARPPRNAAYGA